MDSSNQLLLTDTVVYQMSKEHQKDKLPFLKANDEIFMVQSVPDKCKKADIRLLNIENLKEN